MSSDNAKSPVFEVLSTLQGCGQKIFYFPNGGNAGDALINLGFYEVARRVGLEFEEVEREDIPKIPTGSVAIVAGGGALVPEWSATPRTVNCLVDAGLQGIILPHSIRGVDELISALPNNWVVFCREKKSEAYCRSLDPAAKILLDHDMAFHLDAIKLRGSSLPRGVFFRKVLSPKNWLRYAASGYHLIRSLFNKELAVFRCDKEANPSLDVPRRKYNDLSAVARFGSGTRSGSAYSGILLLKLIDRYQVIHTDRLHVAIAASMLGKDVTVYSNSYYKLDAVYEMSIEGRYPRSRRNRS